MQSWLLIACVDSPRASRRDSGAETAEEGQRTCRARSGPEGDSAPPALRGDDQDSGVSLPGLAPVANAGSDMEPRRW